MSDFINRIHNAQIKQNEKISCDVLLEDVKSQIEKRKEKWLILFEFDRSKTRVEDRLRVANEIGNMFNGLANLYMITEDVDTFRMRNVYALEAIPSQYNFEKDPNNLLEYKKPSDIKLFGLKFHIDKRSTPRFINNKNVEELLK